MSRLELESRDSLKVHAWRIRGSMSTSTGLVIMNDGSVEESLALANGGAKSGVV